MDLHGFVGHFAGDFGAVLPFSSVYAVDVKTDDQKLSYAMGHQFGVQLRNNIKIENLDAAAFSEAIKDVLSGAKTKITVQEMQAAVSKFAQKQAEEKQKVAAINQQKGDAFLKKNKKEKGIVETASGLQYKVIMTGSGKKPSADDTVVVHYKGTLLDGTVFDSSYERGKPTSLKASGVIKGWQEAIQLMKEGSKWKIFIPGKLAYGEAGAGGVIGPNETLIFDIELIEVK